MFSSLESNWMESFCKGVCLKGYKSDKKFYKCCNDILHLNIFLDKLEMQGFVRSSVHHVTFNIAMTHEQYITSFWWKIVLMIFAWLKILVVTTPLFEKTKRWDGNYTLNASTNWFAKPRWVDSSWLSAWYFVRSPFFSSWNFDEVKIKRFLY